SDRRENEPRNAAAPTLQRGRDCRHAACSIFHSDWIAFLLSYTYFIPYCGRFTLLMLAFASQAGDPGTVEKTEFCNVVMLLSCLRYGSIAVSTKPGTLSAPLPPST